MVSMTRISIALAALAGCLAMQAAEIPRKPLDIEITMPDGKKVHPGDFHGKVLCLAFILTT